MRVLHYRLHSSLIPFGSHPVNPVPWWDEFGEQLAEIGAYARQEGMRLSMHPGQFVALSSPREDVLTAAHADLRYHTRLLDAMDLDGEHKLVIHGGGTYGDREAAMARFGAVAWALPDGVRRRLTWRTTSTSSGPRTCCRWPAWRASPWSSTPCTTPCTPARTPRRADLLQACFATWGPADGPPDTHFSTQDAAKQAGAHGWGIDGAEFARFAADTGPTAVDCMLEAKGKERALLQLRQDLATPSPATLQVPPGGSSPRVAARP